MREYRVATVGVEIAVRDAGAGRPVLVLHGFTGNAASMAPISDPLVTAGFRVVAPDLIGHGNSSAPSEVAAYSMARCVEQLRGVVADIGAPTVDVVGYSMGARTALALAVGHPDIVGQLVLIGGTAGLSGLERADRIRADEALADHIEAIPIESFVDEWIAKPIFASQGSLPAEVRAAARAQRLLNTRHGLANSLRGMGTGAMPPLHDELARLHRPVLVLAGELDPKFTALGRYLASCLPFGSFRTIAAAGHACHLEQPAATAAAVLEFFGR